MENEIIKIQHKDQLIRISHDLTNYCNVRCKFCLNDFNKSKTHINMQEETFKKSIQLLPLAKENLFLLSCMFEITLHPDFEKFLYKIPKMYSNKIIFTTNLARQLSDEQLRSMIKSPIGNINISLETFNQELYSKITQSVNSYFYDNLYRLAKIYAETEESKISFITMILKDNFDELYTIVKTANDLFHPKQHFLRYLSSGNDENYIKSQILDFNKVKLKVDEIAKEFPAVIFEGSISDRFENTNGVLLNRTMHYNTRIDPNGIMTFRTPLKVFDAFDITTLQDPLKYVTDIITELEILEANAYKYEDDHCLYECAYSNDIQCRLIEFIISRKCYAYIKGHIHNVFKECEELFLLIKVGSLTYFYKTTFNYVSGIFNTIVNLSELTISRTDEPVEFFVCTIVNGMLRMNKCYNTSTDVLINSK